MKLSVQHISKVYKEKEVLSDISFEVNAEEVLGIVGPNGAGKSTLLRIVSGIIDSDKGQVLWNDQPLSIIQSSAWGYLPEERGLYPQMKILDQLVHFATLKGLSSAEAKKRAMSLLEDCKMLQYSNTQASELSKGNQQRIQFLTSIIHDPALIILDEPFSGLDPVQADWLKEQVKSFQRQGKLVLYSSHRMDSVEALCDRVMILHEGKRVAYSTTEQLCQQEERSWELWLKGGTDRWMEKYTCTTVRIEKSLKYVKLNIEEKQMHTLIEELEREGVSIEKIQRARRTLHDVFVTLTHAVDVK